MWERIHTRLGEWTHEHAGREEAPSAAILDSQSVRTSAKGGKGLRWGQVSDGPEASSPGEHIGLSAPGCGSSGGPVRPRVRPTADPGGRGRFPRLGKTWADQGDSGALARWAAEALGVDFSRPTEPEEPYRNREVDQQARHIHDRGDQGAADDRGIEPQLCQGDREQAAEQVGPQRNDDHR